MYHGVPKECVFEALSWDVDWTAPASSNYGINAAWQHGK